MSEVTEPCALDFLWHAIKKGDEVRAGAWDGWTNVVNYETWLPVVDVLIDYLGRRVVYVSVPYGAGLRNNAIGLNREHISGWRGER